MNGFIPAVPCLGDRHGSSSGTVFKVLLGVQFPDGPARGRIIECPVSNISLSGFATALSWQGLFYCFVGCLWGTIVGVLPGLGPLAGMTLLLPLTFGSTRRPASSC